MTNDFDETAIRTPKEINEVTRYLIEDARVPTPSGSAKILWARFVNHYWDSLEGDKALILQHVKAVLDYHEANPSSHVVADASPTPQIAFLESMAARLSQPHYQVVCDTLSQRGLKIVKK